MEKIDQLFQLIEDKNNLKEQQKQAIASILSPEQKKKIEEISLAFFHREQSLEIEMNFLEEQVKNEVLQKKESTSGVFLQAIFNRGRVSWDSKKLDGFSVLHPEILNFRKAGKPFVSIRKTNASCATSATSTTDVALIAQED